MSEPLVAQRIQCVNSFTRGCFSLNIIIFWPVMIILKNKLDPLTKLIFS